MNFEIIGKQSFELFPIDEESCQFKELKGILTVVFHGAFLSGTPLPGHQARVPGGGPFFPLPKA
ncbi:hypothetical protein CCR92_04585 [Rhodospirillum rubrum]|nr:hypothetical protein [Rhodospirillum rubrum]HAQ01160.1 hypothetical protein [Rhodospirillum rubrum]HCF17907.1 hypothetical protein [Rhodospirillum rubrum]